MGILDGYAFDPNSTAYQGQPPGWLGPQLLRQIMGSPGFSDQGQLPPTSSPTNGVTLPQQGGGMPGAAAGDSNPFTGLFSGLTNSVGGLFGGGQPSAPQQPGQPQQQPQQAPQPSLMDHLGAAWQGLGNGGLTSAVRGLVSGQRADPAGLLQTALTKNYGVDPATAEALVKNPQFLQMAAPTLLAAPQQHATMQALVQAGIPPAVAQAAALNPKVLETIAPQLYSKPTLQETGTNPLTGQKSFSWVQPDTLKTTPAINEGAPVAPGTANAPSTIDTTFNQIDQARQTGATQQQLMQFVPQSIRSGVQAMLAGQAIPSNLSNRGAARDMTVRFAHAVDPSFDETAIPARVALQKDYQGGGKAFEETNALNTVSGHLGRLMTSAQALPNGEWKPINVLRNMWADNVTGSPALVRFRNDLVTTQNELAKAYHGGHVSDSAYAAFNKSINEAQTPEEMKASIQELAGLLGSKIESRESAYKTGMNGLPMPSQYQALNNHAKESFARINAWGNPQSPQPQQPGAPQTSTANPNPTVLPEPDAQGWISLPNGIRIREKK